MDIITFGIKVLFFTMIMAGMGKLVGSVVAPIELPSEQSMKVAVEASVVSHLNLLDEMKAELQ